MMFSRSPRVMSGPGDEEKKRFYENKQSRYWSITSWAEDPPAFDQEEMQYLCYQQELTSDGRPHWQGFLILPRYGQRMSRVKQMMGPGVHVEPKTEKTTKHQMREYTRKAESAVPGTWLEFGDFEVPVGPPGSSAPADASDYSQAVRMIMDGAKMSAVAEAFPKVYTRHQSGFKALQFQAMLGGKPEDVEKNVLVFWGETRTGKTFAAKKYVDEHHAGNTYWLKSSKQALWFDGYERDTCIVIDDFEGNMSIDNFLHLTDRYAGRHTWQVKGGHTRLYHNTIVITSNSSPQTWFREEKSAKVQAMLARITKTTHFQKFPLFTPVVIPKQLQAPGAPRKASQPAVNDYSMPPRALFRPIVEEKVQETPILGVIRKRDDCEACNLPPLKHPRLERSDHSIIVDGTPGWSIHDQYKDRADQGMLQALEEEREFMRMQEDTEAMAIEKEQQEQAKARFEEGDDDIQFIKHTYN